MMGFGVHHLQTLYQNNSWKTAYNITNVQETLIMLAKTFHQLMVHDKPPGGFFTLALKRYENL